MKLKLIASAITAAIVGSSAYAATETIDLAFILDRSGSVGSGNYDAAESALIAALNANVPDPTPDREYRVTVISFASSASTLISDVWDSEGGATDVSITNAIAEGSYSGGATCYDCAFTNLENAVGDIGLGIGIINMMTDGNPNRPGGVDSGEAAAISGAAALRNNYGWDSLSFEAVIPVLNNTTLDTAFLQGIAFDTNGVGGVPVFNNPNQINDPLNQSFVLEISDFGASYQAAVAQKIQKVIDPDPIPVPMAAPLLASGLGLMGFMGWRRRKS